MDSTRQQSTGLIADIECERIVLSSIINRPLLFNEAREHLTPACFHDLKLQEVFQVITILADRGDPVSCITINAELQKKQSLVSMIDIVDMMEESTTADIVSYALRLKELACRRKLWEIGQRLVQAGLTEAEDILDVQIAAKDDIDTLLTFGSANYTTLADKYQVLQQIIIRNRAGVPTITGTPTGYAELDRRGGLMPSDLIVIAGESSHGKTAFATSLVLSAIQHDCPVAFYSMELSTLQLTARITAMKSGISSLSLLQRPLYHEQVMEVEQNMVSVPMDLLYFDDNPTSSIDSILASIRTMKLKHNIGGVVIDYLQILNVNMRSANVEQQMAAVARRLKNLALELNIWVIALSQLNRNSDNPFPTLARLRDSGQIAEAADVVMFVYRPEASTNARVKKYPEPFEQAGIEGTALIDVAKGRNIGIFRFLCGFRSHTTEFYELSNIPQSAEPNGEQANPNCPF